jgi:hypothetical protein
MKQNPSRMRKLLNSILAMAAPPPRISSTGPQKQIGLGLSSLRRTGNSPRLEIPSVFANRPQT